MLTLEQLRALPSDDWVWLVDVKTGKGEYVTHLSFSERRFSALRIVRGGYTAWRAPRIADYGKTWIAYKNKEDVSGPPRIQAKYKVGDTVYFPNFHGYVSLDEGKVMDIAFNEQGHANYIVSGNPCWIAEEHVYGSLEEGKAKIDAYTALFDVPSAIPRFI